MRLTEGLKTSSAWQYHVLLEDPEAFSVIWIMVKALNHVC
jgi:hypothetical protein